MMHSSHKIKKLSRQRTFESFLELPDKSQFLNKINRTDFCWIWEGRKNVFGYGEFTHNKNSVLAHRASYAIYKGDIGNLFVLHRCDHRDCVNPDHLFLGTASENFKDMFRKGRNSSHIYRTGDENASSKLKDLDVLAIYRGLRQHSSLTLSKRFGVTQQSITKIRRGAYPRLKRLLLQLKIEKQKY